MLSSRNLRISCSIQSSLLAYVKRQICNKNICQDKYSLVQLPERGLLRVHGKEASSFLQGLVTNDMRHLESNLSMYSMFLNTRGRVLCDTIIYKDQIDTFLVECDKDAVSSLQRHLKMYRVRKKIDIDLMEKLGVWVIFSNKAFLEVVGGVINVPTFSDQENLESVMKTFQQSKIISRDPRLAALGYRLIVPTNEEMPKDNKLVEENQSGIYRQLRYKLGVGEGVAELPPGKCFPLELNCDYLHGVSFHKGCYIGQELTARVHHTGVVRKRLMPITLNLEPTETFVYDACVESAVDKKAIGKLRGLEYIYGLGLLKVTEALAAPALSMLNVTGLTWKPTWWPQGAPKERLSGKEMEAK